jgi:heavy metal response regulator
MRILVAEDDESVSGFIRRGLVQEGFAVDVTCDGRAAFRQALDVPYDVVVLDILMPFMDGFDVLKEIRKAGSHVPVLILSAKDAVEDRVRGLNSGADDYLVKPFSFAELTARIRALLRRPTDVAQTVMRLGDLEIDYAARKVTRAGRRINLTPKEFSLLEYLARNRGNVLTRAMIAEHVWDQHFDTCSNVIDVYIRYLRSKVDGASAQKLIHTVRGVGYVLTAEHP